VKFVVILGGPGSYPEEWICLPKYGNAPAQEDSRDLAILRPGKAYAKNRLSMFKERDLHQDEDTMGLFPRWIIYLVCEDASHR
jgi:hypothetical protein